jgi:hypothetical protein
VAALAASTAQAHRLHGYTQKYRDVPNPAEPVAVSYCGGAGTEYLSGAAIQPDGKIVAVGTALGAPLRIGRAVEAEVIGRDSAEPIYDADAIAALPGRSQREHLTWTHPNRTPFLVRFSPDLQDVLFAVRLPWRAGSITDVACDAAGNVYIAGLAGATLDRAGPVTDVSAEPAGATTAYVARLTPDLRKIEWIRTFTDAHKGPLIRINDKGEIGVEGGWLYVFQPDGRMTHTTQLMKTGKWVRVVNPKDHTFAVSGESMWGTGREPWRCPHLLLGLPGPKTYRMYQWPGPFAGLNSLRLVSDSVIRKMYCGDDGLLYIAGWSDGGNSVFLREPCDIRRGLAYKGMALECWGVGATSFSHLLKIDPVTAKVKGYTLWSAFRGSDGAPNGLGVDIIRPATDGSVLIAGGSAFGLLQTGNSLHRGDPGGTYISIFEPDFRCLRFSSILPACAGAEVRANESWGIGVGVANGRHRAVYVGSAAREGMTYSTGPHPAATLNAFQPEFGGGVTDGWVGLFDLGPVTNRVADGVSPVAGGAR